MTLKEQLSTLEMAPFLLLIVGSIAFLLFGEFLIFLNILITSYFAFFAGKYWLTKGDKI